MSQGKPQLEACYWGSGAMFTLSPTGRQEPQDCVIIVKGSFSWGVYGEGIFIKGAYKALQGGSLEFIPVNGRLV